MNQVSQFSTATRLTFTPPFTNGILIDVTREKETEKALRESERKRQSWIENSPVCTKIVDLDFNLQFMSASGIRDLKIDNINEFYGKPYPFHFYPDSFNFPMTNNLKKAKETGAIITQEASVLDIEGNKLWYHSTIVPVNDDEGKINYMLVVSLDTTERKRAEEALRESEEKHKRIVENALTGIYQVEKEGGFIMANQRIAEMFGYDSPESLMSSVDSIASLYVHPEERAMILQEIDEKGSVYGKEVKFKRKTGEHFWVKYHVRVLRDKEKTIYEGLMEDVTAEKSSQEAQRASELRYRSLFENASMGISLTTSDGQMLDANNSILQMMSASRSDIEQLNVTDFYKNFQDRESLLKRLERDGSVHGFETILKRKDGTLFDARLNLTKLNIDNRDLLLTIIEDFTKEKTLTENLERAQRMEAIGTLAGGVAHDLNNILGGLVSYPELLLLKLPEDSPLRDMVSTIQKSGEKAAATVQDLLTLARRGLLVTELINLNDVVSEYLQSPEHNKLQTYHPEVHLETRLERYPLHIEGSPIHLSKTVMNLISNAAEAMPEGGNLIVSTENRYIERPIRGYDNVKEGDYVVLTVSDTGTGISPDDIDKIFEPFYTKKKMGRSGTGLGMAVVWGTVKDHNGYIDVQSAEGKGTTFTLYFPVTRKNLPQDKSHLAIESYSGNGEFVLIIDDVEEQRKIATGMLEELCYSVASVSSGEEAVEYLKTNKADLILLDMIMDPGMDGLDTYKKILEIHPGQKAIIASGFSETDRVKEVQSLGARTYIRKPFLLEKIGIAVKETLEKQAAFDVLLNATALHVNMNGRFQSEDIIMSERPTHEKLDFLMDNPLLGIVYLDKQYRIVRCNVKFEEMFGYKLEEIKRKNLDEVVDGDQDMTMITQTGESIHGSGKRKRKNGTYMDVEIYGIPKIFGGAISGTLGIYLDITDRKLAEETIVKSQHELEERVKERTAELIRVNEQLQEEIVVREQTQKKLIESEDKYRTYIEHANDGISVVHKGKLTFVNSRLAEIMGYKVDELVGKDFLQFIPKGKLNQITDNLKRRLTGEEVPQVYESRILHKDSSEIDVEFNITTIESNDEPATLTIIRDITERKKAEETLRKNQVIIESNIKYVENMNIISESVSQSTEVGEMIKRVIEDVFNIFKADRAWLLYPCDPDSPTFQVPYEHTKPEYPGALESGIDSPVDEGIKQIFEDLLSTDEVITYDLSNESFRNSEPVKKFYMQSQMVIAMHPKTGSPWVLGLHQCSHGRIWTSEEQKLFKDISLKVKDALNNLLLFKELFNREQFLNRIIDQSPFAIWISDSEGTLQRANPALKRFLNLTDEQLVGKYNVLNDMITERQGLQPLFRTVFEDGKTITFSLEWDGNDMPSMDLKGSNSVNIEATMFPIHNSEGKLTNVVLNWIDITERKQAEEAQRVSEEKYRVLYNNSPDMYVSVSSDNAGILLCNDTLLNKTGYSREEIIGSPIFKMYHDDCIVEAKMAFQQFVETGAIRDKELILKRKDGSKIHVSLNVNAVKDETGQTQYSISSWRDITEAKQAEEALRESEDKFRSFAEQSIVGIYLISDGVFKYVNPKFAEIFGYCTDECLDNMHFPQLVHPEDLATVEKQVGRRLSGETKTVRYSFRGIKKDGETIHVEIFGSSMFLEGKTVVTGTTLDITDQKLAEEERKRLQAQLQQAQKMEAMGTLAGGIAHDFNNLLMAIQGRTSIMQMKKDSSHPDIRHLKGIEDNVESAADLTRQLLGFARGGKYEVKPTDLNELVKKQNRMFGRTKKQISIRGKYEKDLWSVEVDQGQIDQVLLNLYVNAWQAMPAGGDLYLETENVTLDENYVKPFSIEPGKYVKISVTDTGTGMDKATRKKIFDPFFTTKEMGRGTGLGLASAYGIIKNHGGCINVYSEKGHGTTFNIYLPASEKEIIEEKKSDGDTLRGTETVLFVDDEDMIIEVAQELFEQLGYKILIARSGKEAIETYEKNKEHIDIVLLDMIMPDMSGSDTYDRMKEFNPDIKVLLASGYSINGQATEIMDRGCSGFIQKPFKMKELSQKLREILDKK